jgi:hypothetical protein
MLSLSQPRLRADIITRDVKAPGRLRIVTVKLKLFIQQGFSLPKCCAVETNRAADGEPLFTDQGENIRRINELLAALNKRYGERLEISVANSWGFLEFWDVIKLKITPHKPTWVIDGVKLFEGVPSIEELSDAISAQLKTTA